MGVIDENRRAVLFADQIEATLGALECLKCSKHRAGLAIATGSAPEATFAALAHLKVAKGRLEFVGERSGAPIFVDYAHKPDALAKALEALRPYATGRLTVVFGCGGDRDAGKRPLMGAIAEELADVVVVTDDNPRTEASRSIIEQIVAGMRSPHAAQIVADREQAIRQTLADAEAGDVVVIAGKGHEDYQIVGTEKRPFSDRELARTATSEGHA